MNVTSSTPGRNVLSFKLSGSEKMRIASDGSVGIGTAAPATTLDVSGTTTLKGTTNLSNNNIISIGNAGIGTAAPAYKLDVIGSGSDSIVCRLQSGGANTATTYVNTGASNLDVGTGSGGHFIYGYGSYPLYFGVNGSEKMRITSAGNVGIGTSTPASLLDVNGATKIRGALDLSTQNITNANQISATSTLVLQPNGGNICIGRTTSSTGSMFDLSNSIGVRTRYSTSDTSLTIGVWPTTNNSGEAFMWNESGAISFGSNNSERMRITSDGRVGIGTTSPITWALCSISRRSNFRTDLYNIDALGNFFNASNEQTVGFYAANVTSGHAFQYTSISTSIQFSLYIEGGLYVNGGIAASASDKRSKMYINEIDNKNSLECIRSLKPSTFYWKKDIFTEQHPRKNTGFIAQNIKEIIPDGVSFINDYLPTIFSPGTMKFIKVENNYLYYQIVSKNKIELTDLKDPSWNCVFNLKIYVTLTADYKVTVCEIVDDFTIIVKLLESENGCEEKEKLVSNSNNEIPIFIFGQEVDDAHLIEKDAIYTHAVAALQEVDRQQQADKARIAELETEVVSLKQELDKQQTLINSILERLAI